MIKRGFSLIEVMIALLIASMIIGSLFMTLIQLGDTQSSVERVTSGFERAAVFLNQFERDVMGIFIPEQIERFKQDEDAESKAAIDKIFYGTQKDENLELLTFITNNPLQTYLKVKNSKPKPRTARVVYQLVPDKGKKNSFTLMRQEGEDLNFKIYKKGAKNQIRSYAMIEGINSLGVTYLKLDTEKKDGDDQNKRTYKKEKKWADQTKSDEKKKKIELPQFIEITLKLWDAAYEKKIDFAMTIPLIMEPGTRKKPPAVLAPPPVAISSKVKTSSQKTTIAAKKGEKRISLTTFLGGSA